MIICKKCYVPMAGVMSFSREKREKYYRCPKCKQETKHQKIRNFELDFKEVLRKEVHKRK